MAIDTVIPIAAIKTIENVDVLNAALVIIIVYISASAITFILTKLSEKAGMHRVTVKTLIPLLKFSIYGAALYYILKNIFSLSYAESIAFAGLAGAAIGFGLKDLFADIIGGVVITLEKPYQVGDKITMGEYYGEVVDIGLRATRFVTPDDTLVSAPNYMVFTQAVASANAGVPEMQVVIDLYIDSDSDAACAMKILKEAMITSKYVYVSRKRPYTVLLKDYPFYRRLRGKAYVNDLRNEFEFQSDVTRRAWDEFSRKGISAPKVNIMEAERKDET